MTTCVKPSPWRRLESNAVFSQAWCSARIIQESLAASHSSEKVASLFKGIINCELVSCKVVVYSHGFFFNSQHDLAVQRQLLVLGFSWLIEAVQELETILFADVVLLDLKLRRRSCLTFLSLFCKSKFILGFDFLIWYPWTDGIDITSCKNSRWHANLNLAHSSTLVFTLTHTHARTLSLSPNLTITHTHIFTLTHTHMCTLATLSLSPTSTDTHTQKKFAIKVCISKIAWFEIWDARKPDKLVNRRKVVGKKKLAHVQKICSIALFENGRKSRLQSEPMFFKTKQK